MKKLVKTISVMLAVALAAASFVYFPAKADDAPTTRIYIDGVSLYDYTEHMWRNVGQGYSYNEKTNTLYIHGNFNYQKKQGAQYMSCIRVEGDINIVVDGPSLIHLGNSGLIGISVSGNCNLKLKNKLTINYGGGIQVDGKLTVTGLSTNGKLVIKKTGGHYYGGIIAQSIVMKNVSGVNIASQTLFGMHSTGGNVYIKNCKMKVTGHTGAIVAFYGNVTITGKNSITATATAKGAPAIGVVLKNKTKLNGCPDGKGKGKIVLGKKVKVTSPQAVKKKGKTVTKSWSTVKGSKDKITMKVLGLSNGKICSKVTIK